MDNGYPVSTEKRCQRGSVNSAFWGFFFKGDVDRQAFVPETFWCVRRWHAEKQLRGHKNTDRHGYCGVFCFQSSESPGYRHKKP